MIQNYKQWEIGYHIESRYLYVLMMLEIWEEIKVLYKGTSYGTYSVKQ